MRQLKDYKNYEIYKNGSFYYGRNIAGEYTDFFNTIVELKAIIDDDKRSETDCVYDSLYKLYSASKIHYRDLYNDCIYAFCSGYMPKVSISSLFNAVMKLRDLLN